MCISFLGFVFWLLVVYKPAIAKYFHQPNPQLPQSVLDKPYASLRASLRAVSSLLWLLEVLSSAGSKPLEALLRRYKLKLE